MRRPSVAFCVPLVIGVGACVATFAAQTTDDSFITLHFARSLAQGEGLTFNRGTPVEGYTSPTHLVVAVLTYLLPGASYQLLKLKLASVFVGLGALSSVRPILKSLGVKGRAQLATLSLMAASAVFAVASTNGLETSLAMLLTTALVRVATAKSFSPAKFGLVSALCVLTRPDAAVVVGLVWLAKALSRQSLVTKRSWVIAAVVGALPVLAYEVFRWIYFGQLLPNTYYAKHMSLGRSLAPGATYFADAFVPEFPSSLPNGAGDLFVAAVGLGLTASLLLLCALGMRHALRVDQGPAVAAVVGQFFVCLFTGGETIGLRFVAPCWLLVCALIAVGAFRLRTQISRLMRQAQHVVVPFAALLAVVCVGLQWEAGRYGPAWAAGGFDDYQLISRGSDRGFGALWGDSKSLLACAPAGASVAYSEMGYSFWVRPDLTVTDTRGLVDSEVARAPAHLHTRVGVVDPDWRDPTSFIGELLSRRQPELILSIEPDQGSEAIGGKYVRERTKDYGDVTVTVYRRVDTEC